MSNQDYLIETQSTKSDVRLHDRLHGLDGLLVDVIIVSWNHAHFMDALFSSLTHVAYPKDKWRLHIVINKDGDGTLEAVNRLRQMYKTQLPQIIIHEPHANLGFSGGNNLAITWAKQNKSNYVFLLNPDTEVTPDFLVEALMVAAADPHIGTVQSLLLRGQERDQINSKGNAIHFLGFGYCLGDRDPISTAPKELTDITYSSGAAVLIPIKVLDQIGYLDETLHAYHEDLDFGWRVLLTGRRNVLAPKSIVYHHYEFSRSIRKWELMERNRLAVVLKNYSLPTVIVLLPAMLATDLAIYTFALKGGWFWKKFKANCWFLKISTWKYLLSGRARIRQIRVVPDRFLLSYFTYKIEYQELKSGWAERIANPFWQALYISYRILIQW